MTRLALAAALAVAAAAPAMAERQKFEYWYGLTGRLGEVMAEHCTRFNAAQDRYEAVCVGQGGYDKAEQNTIAAYRSKQHPTLVQIYDAGTVNFMLSGAIYPANQFVKDFKMNLDWSDYFRGIANYYATSKGEMWSFPYNSSTALFYWNKDLFAKAGLTAAPATIEEWGEMLARLKAAGVECGFGFDFDTWMPLEQFSAIHNIPLATRNNGYDGLDAELVFNRTKFADYMKLWKDWLDKGYSRIQTQQVGKTTVQAFSDGSCATILTSVANHGVIHGLVNGAFQWDVAMLPVFAGTERHNSLVGGASLWVMAGKSREEYEAAAAFLAWIATPEEVEWMPNVTGYIPVTKSGFAKLKASGFYDRPEIRGREIAMMSLTYTEPNAITRGIRLGNFTQIRAEIRAELEAAFTGQKDMQAALDAAVERGNQILRRFETTFRGQALP